jgi:hypothetical protein
MAHAESKAGAGMQMGGKGVPTPYRWDSINLTKTPLVLLSSKRPGLWSWPVSWLHYTIQFSLHTALTTGPINADVAPL